MVDDYWNAAFHGDPIATGDPHLRLTANARLDPSRRVMTLDRGMGDIFAALTPEIADRCALHRRSVASLSDLAGRLADHGVALHDPDRLFYRPAGAPSAPGHGDPSTVRRLSMADRSGFDVFHIAMPPDDRDEAFVELDHMMLVGAFDGDRLVSAASLYPWDGSRLADVGVMTLPDHRGAGHAGHVVRQLRAAACEEGYELQFRCRTDNHASLALAVASGLERYGDWRVAVSDDR